MAPMTRLEALRDAWPRLDEEERIAGFGELDPEDTEEFFLALAPRGQSQILLGIPEGHRRRWMRMMPPDDAADVMQEVEAEERAGLMGLLDEPTRREVNALLAYAEDDAGGLMSPRFARLRPDMSADEAIRYLRRQATANLETLYYVYVLDSEQHLLGVVSFREIFGAPPDCRVRDIMQPRDKIIAVPEDLDQEAVARLFSHHDLLALPVVDAADRVRGIVTIDDIVDVVEEEATEDVQKFGGMEALEAPYLQTSLLAMVRKRAGWLAILFVGEMFTASAMQGFQDEIAKAVVLAMFMPLIISSGGNSGSQASTLVIRAMALGEVKLRDWFRIIRREFAAGLLLGLILAVIGAIRIIGWQAAFDTYGPHYGLITVAVCVSILGIVTWGTIVGSMLPFILRRFHLDPASASAPFVATLVDVFGLILYFNVAGWVLGGTLL